MSLKRGGREGQNAAAGRGEERRRQAGSGGAAGAVPGAGTGGERRGRAAAQRSSSPRVDVERERPPRGSEMAEAREEPPALASARLGPAPRPAPLEAEPPLPPFPGGSRRPPPARPSLPLPSLPSPPLAAGLPDPRGPLFSSTPSASPRAPRPTPRPGSARPGPPPRPPPRPALACSQRWQDAKCKCKLL